MTFFLEYSWSIRERAVKPILLMPLQYSDVVVQKHALTTHIIRSQLSPNELLSYNPSTWSFGSTTLTLHTTEDGVRMFVTIDEPTSRAVLVEQFCCCWAWVAMWLVSLPIYFAPTHFKCRLLNLVIWMIMHDKCCYLGWMVNETMFRTCTYFR